MLVMGSITGVQILSSSKSKQPWNINDGILVYQDRTAGTQQSLTTSPDFLPGPFVSILVKGRNRPFWSNSQTHRDRGWPIIISPKIPSLIDYALQVPRTPALLLC
jgi:hypothetical protein